jgi:hypothetical protein
MKKLDDFTIEIRKTSPSYFGEQVYIVELAVFKQALLSCINEGLPPVGIFFENTYTLRPTGLYPKGHVVFTTWINLCYFNGPSIRLSLTREYLTKDPYNDYSYILTQPDIDFVRNTLMEWADDIQPSC